MARAGRVANLDLFMSAVESAPEPTRRIGKEWVAPEHRPTKAVPDSLLVLPSAIRERQADRADAVVRKLEARLGRPHTHRAGFVLYNVDCRMLMAAMHDVGVEVDLTLTSPPYNIGKEYERPLPLDEYVRWCADWLGDI